MEAGDGVGRAADLWARHPFDLLLAGGGIRDRRLGHRIDGRQAHLNQAHPAVPGDGELGVIAIVGHVDPDEPRGLDHVRSLRHGNLPSVDVDGDEDGMGRRGHAERSQDGRSQEPGVSIARA